jgi:putative restriction endonuclease
MPSVFVYSAGQTAAKHFERSIQQGIPLTTFRSLLPADAYGELEQAYPDGVCYLWGDRGGEHGRQYWQQISPGDLALCYRNRRIVAASTVVATLENEAAGLQAWPDAVNEPYRLLFFLSKPVWTDVPVASLPQYFGKVYQGLRRLPTSGKILEDFGSVDRFVSEALLDVHLTAVDRPLPDALSAEKILEAVQLFDAGVEHRFAESTGYDLVIDGKRYPPKAIAGIASGLATGTQYGPEDFSGGEGSKCFRLLRQAGFEIVAEATASAWLFQGNPRRFDVDGYLRQNSFIYWGVNRYTSDFRVGDACLIWRAGSRAGLIGVGTVAELPKAIADVSHPERLGRDLWQQEGDIGNELKVGIQLKEVRIDEDSQFVSRKQWLADPVLAQTSIIRFRQGSVFRLTAQESGAALALWQSKASAETPIASTSGNGQSSGFDRLLTIFDDSGRPLRATCRIAGLEKDWGVVVESRGGTLGSASETNADYAQGFGLIVSRLAAIDAVITDALVDSKKLVDAGLDESERRLHPDGFTFPIQLAASTSREFTKALRRAQPNVGSDRQTGAGNSTRRVLIKAELRQLPANVTMEDYLTGAKAFGLTTTQDLTSQAAPDIFEPASITDERTKTMAAIVRRQGAPQFRRLLMEAYAGRCAITGCDAEPALEAAHIIAYLGPRTNSAQNGILLRADLHTLFDRGLLGIDPRAMQVCLHPSLRTTAYASLHGKSVELPRHTANWPSREALRRHLVACGWDSLRAQ